VEYFAEKIPHQFFKTGSHPERRISPSRFSKKNGLQHRVMNSAGIALYSAVEINAIY
jgi:hypothetical protein